MDIQQSLTNLAVTGNDNRVGLFFTNYQTNFEEEDTSRILFRDRWKQARGLSEGVARCPNPESTLRAIIKSFRESLATMFTTSSEEFDEPSSMVRDIQDQCQGAEESSRLLRACKKIDGFAHYLKSYFHVVEIFVTGDTDCSLLACSALHLVFSLSSRYVNIFETLADMLSKMTNMLPRYWHYLQRLRGQDLRGINSHFGYALSFLYADILQFCRDACQVLAPKCSAERSNEDNLFELLWAPIDIRFQLMLDRFQDLTELGGPRTSYKNERAPAPGVPEVDKEETIEWLKRGEGLKLFIEKVRKDLDTREEIRVNHEKRCELRKKKEMLYETRLRHIVQWMSPPDFVGGSCESSDYEQARRRRKPHSCAWILHDPTYASWKWRDESSSNILWLEAKPGFGKTTLSVTIIEDLRDAADEISTDMYSPFVAYFHFDLQRPDKRSYSDALRALIVQFIYSSAPDTEFIDAISLFKYPHNGEQQKPSVDNMMEIFLLCASRLPQLSLVLDGVDECEKFGDLLSLLVEACTRNKNLNIIFLGRPSVPLPIRYRNIVTRHSLHDSNRSDIRDYLLDELGELKGSNKLEDGLDLGELADILTLRADSMFLWATLMVSYLGLSAHSPAARTKTIQVTNCLQELDELYRELLKQYGKKTQAERDVLAKILHILIMAEHPPTLQQMKIAIAIIPGRSLSKADFLTNFPDALREICGALVEIRPDNTVQLVHLSLREVLCSEQTAHIDIPFKADSRSASLFLSVISLSYLIHDVPRRHLADSPQTIANTSELNNRFPFLEFAARTWVNHAIIAINSDASTLAELIPTCQPLVQQLLDFVRHSGSISMWIEACWTYGFAPSIVHLWEALDRRRHSPTPVTQRSPVEMEIEPFIERIQSLSQDLNRLHIEWHHLLQIRPYEIWGASISGFMGPLSWARNIDAKLYLIGSEHLHESNTETIIVRSKVSDCGRLIGVVKILRPSNVE
ncbi:hypothetical protein K491DRAFT_716037 [Lophiostoma macrostomum CBS 122681]|uniref:Nephrocystin 3-like N-terminal domain-containing protein n=1 Tax=Lophiostoma macrostomum CBS 122681 TaxID=1314788 RepID=A0A6A6TA30_9PLEO|nr:hypothetical protein K491DRAFT_716037 [Lophiostoma macrostomum CBS 122681]